MRAGLLDVRRPALAAPGLLSTCALLAALGGGCGGAGMDLDSPGPGRIAVEPPLSAGCNPLGGGPGEDCLLPFPSDVFTRPDATRATGRRIELSAQALPASRKGVRLDPQPLGRRDGFSPATPILAYFPRALGPIDPMLLPGPGRIEETLSDKSPVQLLRYDTGERVPISAELDHNASDGERQAIVIYPQLRLREKTRYVVALRGLRTRSAAGAVRELPPLTGFKALRDDRLQIGSARERQRPRYAEIFALLAKHGVPRGELQLAWDFTTASDEPLTGRLVRMRDQALGYKPSGEVPPPPVTVQKSTDKPREFLSRQVLGTFSVPSFLKSDADGRLLLGPDGEPVVRGWGQFPLVIHIPACAERSMAPLPVMIFGHGLFGDALGEMDSSYERELANRLCMIQIGTNWIGLSEAEQAYAAGEIMADFNNFVQLTDRLQQAHINFLYLARLVRSGVLERLPEGDSETAADLTTPLGHFQHGDRLTLQWQNPLPGQVAILSAVGDEHDAELTVLVPQLDSESGPRRHHELIEVVGELAHVPGAGHALLILWVPELVPPRWVHEVLARRALPPEARLWRYCYEVTPAAASAS